MAICRPSPVISRVIVMPGMRLKDSAMLVSGNLPMSSAKIASTKPTASRLASVEFCRLCRIPGHDHFLERVARGCGRGRRRLCVHLTDHCANADPENTGPASDVRLAYIHLHPLRSELGGDPLSLLFRDRSGVHVRGCARAVVSARFRIDQIEIGTKGARRASGERPGGARCAALVSEGSKQLHRFIPRTCDSLIKAQRSAFFCRSSKPVGLIAVEFMIALTI